MTCFFHLQINFFLSLCSSRACCFRIQIERNRVLLYLILPALLHHTSSFSSSERREGFSLSIHLAFSQALLHTQKVACMIVALQILDSMDDMNATTFLLFNSRQSLEFYMLTVELRQLLRRQGFSATAEVNFCGKQKNREGATLFLNNFIASEPFYFI